MAVMSTSTNTANLNPYFVKKLLSVLYPRLQLYKLGKKTSLPKNEGKQVKWLQYAKISSSTTPLTEGTNPSEISVATSNVTANIAQYGQYSKVSDLLQMTAKDPVLNELAKNFGKAGAETIEDLIVAELDSALTARRVNGASDDDAITTADVLTMKELLKAQIALKGAYVGPHEMGQYMAVLHPDNEFDIRTETNLGALNHVQEEADKSKLITGELGRAFGMRFLVSDKMTKADNASSVSVKQNYLIGEECFGCVELGGKGVELIIKPHDSGGQANPLNMYATVGYKLQGFVAKSFGSGARGRQIGAASSYTG